MAKVERYFIGPNARAKLQDVFAFVGQVPNIATSGARDLGKLQHMQRRLSSLRLCKTTAAFNKGSVATLNVWEDGTPPSETQTSGSTVEDVVNKYANIASGKFVSVAIHGNGRWYVVAAECS
jgi:hypothetical protein